MAEEAVKKKTIQVEIVTPERDPVQLKVREITVPGGEGVFTVLPDHTPLLSTLTTGVVVARCADGQDRFYAVTRGFAEVLDDRVVILAETLEGEKEIDVARAEAAKERAEQRLKKPDEKVDIARAEAALERALTRLEVNKRHGY